MLDNPKILIHLVLQQTNIPLPHEPSPQCLELLELALVVPCIRLGRNIGILTHFFPIDLIPPLL